jgi:hypothetical protein
MAHRGKRRIVVEVLARERVRDDATHGHYQTRVRLSCGHTALATAHRRYRKDADPVVGYCNHPECIMAEVEA